jgi:hypothetical protein
VGAAEVAAAEVAGEAEEEAEEEPSVPAMIKFTVAAVDCDVITRPGQRVAAGEGEKEEEEASVAGINLLVALG